MKRILDYPCVQSCECRKANGYGEPAFTSQKCSGCGVIVARGLSVRWHACPECGTSLHRNHSAALNLLRLEAGAAAIRADGAIIAIYEEEVFRCNVTRRKKCAKALSRLRIASCGAHVETAYIQGTVVGLSAFSSQWRSMAKGLVPVARYVSCLRVSPQLYAQRAAPACRLQAVICS